MSSYTRIKHLHCRPEPGAPEYIVERHDDPDKRWHFKFSVVGKGRFPFDMLRHDRCYPRDSVAASWLDDGERGVREIELVSEQLQRGWLPTFERWRSFGWVVVTDAEG
jgi:hypothetical protein